MAGGPTLNVDWISSSLTNENFSNYNLSLPAATLSLVVINPGLDELFPAISEQDGAQWFSVKFHPIPNASAVHYQLLGSADLTSWETVAETNSSAADWISLTNSQPIAISTNHYFRVKCIAE
jgi:hypothetical protein